MMGWTCFALYCYDFISHLYKMSKNLTLNLKLTTHDWNVKRGNASIKSKIKSLSSWLVYTTSMYTFRIIYVLFYFLYEVIGWLPWLNNLINTFQAQCVVLNNNPLRLLYHGHILEGDNGLSCHMQIYVPRLVYGTKGIPRLDSTLLLIKPGRRISNSGDNSRNDRVFINWAIIYSTLENPLPLFDFFFFNLSQLPSHERAGWI